MITIINRKNRKEKIKELLTAINDKEIRLLTSKYSGKLKLKKNPLAI